jgi:hypothetical protein
MAAGATEQMIAGVVVHSQPVHHHMRVRVLSRE